MLGSVLFMMREILVSRVRIKTLELFLEKGAPEFFHVREITRRVGTEINAVRRELDRLVRAGFLRREPRGNRVYFRVRREFPLFDDLLSMVAKETGLGCALLNSLGQLGNVKLIILSKLFHLGRTSKPTEVDLFILGKIDFSVLDKIIKAEEKKLSQEINYTVLTEEEFDFRKKRKDNFITNLLLEPRLVLYGNEEKYLKLTV